MKTVKVLIYGPKESGKTSLIQQTINKTSVDQLTRIPPTVLIQHVRDFKHNQYNCSFFDCGGQLKFFEQYNNELATAVFKKVTILFYVVDSRLYFEEDYKNEIDAGRKAQDALHIARDRYTKVAQKEFWRAAGNLLKFSADTLKIMVLLAHKKDAAEAMDPNQIKQMIIGKPSKELVPNIDEFYQDIKENVTAMPVFPTSIRDISGVTGLSSAEKVIFTFLDKLQEILPVDTEKAKLQQEEILAFLKLENQQRGLVGSLLINMEDPALSVYAFQEKELGDIRNYTWQFDASGQGMLNQLGDKSMPESIFFIGERFYVNILRVNEIYRLIAIIQRKVENLPEKFQALFSMSQKIKEMCSKLD